MHIVGMGGGVLQPANDAATVRTAVSVLTGIMTMPVVIPIARGYGEAQGSRWDHPAVA